MPEDEEVPEAVKGHKCGWYMVFTLFIGCFIGSLVALKIFDALIALIIGIWAYYLVKDECKQMSQQCLFSFGLMCCMQAVMEFIILAMSLPGRRTTTTTQANGSAGHGTSPHAAPSPFQSGSQSSSYTVTTSVTPFFSEEQGWHYNLVSAMMIANCLVFIIGALWCRHSYGQYPNSLFADRGESSPIQGSSGGGGGGRYYGGGGGGQHRPANSFGGGGGQRLGGGSAPGPSFGGSGQRLGSV